MIQMGKSPPRLYTCKLCKMSFPAGKGKFFKSSVVRGGEDFQCMTCCNWETNDLQPPGNINTTVSVVTPREVVLKGPYAP